VDVIADAFGDEGLAWILYDLIGGDFQDRADSAATLGLTVRYCRRILTQHIEGVPLQLQCAIVPRGWWEKNQSSFPALLKLTPPYARISTLASSRLDQMIHFSDGASSLFVIEESGDIRALVDLAQGPVYTRPRIDYLRSKFDGIVISTDERRQIWIHSNRKLSPLILAEDRWQLDPAHAPLQVLRGALAKRQWPEPAIDRLRNVIAVLSDERIGGFLIVCADPPDLQNQLKAAQLRQDVSPHFALPMAADAVSVPSLVRTFSLDGAHIFDNRGNLCLLCQMLNPPAFGSDVGHGGTKHATARRAAKTMRDAAVIVVSHDGPITVYADGDVTTNAGTRAY